MDYSVSSDATNDQKIQNALASATMMYENVGGLHGGDGSITSSTSGRVTVPPLWSNPKPTEQPNSPKRAVPHNKVLLSFNFLACCAVVSFVFLH